MSRLNGNLNVTGHLSAGSMTVPSNSISKTAIKSPVELPRTDLAQRAGAVHTIPLTAWRVWDNLASLLPATSANDDLGLASGTFGTDGPTIRTSDLKAAGATTRYARALLPLPDDYETGETVTIRFRAGMVTTVADSSATLDVEAYETDREGGLGGSPTDLCATDAIDINSLTFADRDFTITPTDLAAGDLLDVRIALAVNDAASGTAVIAAVGDVQLLADAR